MSGLRQPYVTVDTTAAIPTGVWLVRVVYTHCHHILAFTDIRSDIVFEAGVSIGSVPHQLTIDIDRRIHIHAVELDIIVYS